ncbi:hypothetical protein CKA32_005703 [Geitlerinema sp. FC II]|nr:hypothetical protein CKA32_005703 [Geitlerinema sp. FC II]
MTTFPDRVVRPFFSGDRRNPRQAFDRIMKISPRPFASALRIELAVPRQSG